MNEPGVHVTLDHIYKTQQDMAITLAEIKGALALQSAQDRADKALLTDHESRIRKVEAKVYALPSIATVVALGTLGWSVFGPR